MHRSGFIFGRKANFCFVIPVNGTGKGSFVSLRCKTELNSCPAWKWRFVQIVFPFRQIRLSTDKIHFHSCCKLATCSGWAIFILICSSHHLEIECKHCQTQCCWTLFLCRGKLFRKQFNCSVIVHVNVAFLIFFSYSFIHSWSGSSRAHLVVDRTHAYRAIRETYLQFNYTLIRLWAIELSQNRPVFFFFYSNCDNCIFLDSKWVNK